MRRFAFFVLFAAVTAAQVVPNQYVVELSGDPAVRTLAKRTAHLAAHDPQFRSHRAAVRASQRRPRAALVSAGAQVLDSVDTVANALIVSIPDSEVSRLSNVPGVLRIHRVHLVRKTLDHALPIHKVPDAWATLSNGQSSAGLGIKIAMIDTGIDVNHPGFQDASLTPPDGFPLTLTNGDVQYTNNKIIVAKNFTFLLGRGASDSSADDLDGHGTGTAMAAAGETCNSPWGAVTGVAPKAFLGNYKVFTGSGATTDAVILRAIDDAVADGMDVINMSLGGPVVDSSQLDPNDIFQNAIENAVSAGVIVSVSAGNDGPDPGTVADFASAPDAIAVGAILNDRTLGSSVTVTDVPPYLSHPGNGPDPGQAISGPLVDVTTLDSTGLACSGLPNGSLNGSVALIERGTCAFADKINNAAAAGAIAALIWDNNPADAGLSMSVGTATLAAMSVNNAAGLDLQSRVAATPGLQVTLDFSGMTNFPNHTDLTAYSSRGPSLGSALKPDIVAVGGDYATGTFVTAAQDSYSSGESYGASGFIQTAGTSFSSPITAGAAAVLKAARPGLTVQQYRSLLINTAGPASMDANTGASVSQAGAGMLNVLSAVQNNLTASPTSLNFGTSGGTVDITLNLALTNVGSAADTFSITAVPSGSSPAPALATNAVQLDGGATQAIPVEFAASDLAPGEYYGFVQITGTATRITTTVPYWFAVPGGDPAHVAVVYQPYTDSVGTHTEEFIFRLLDQAGLPYQGSLQPSVVSDQTRGVRSVYGIGDIPGTYTVNVRLASGLNTFTITAGPVTQTVVVQAQ